MKMMKMIVRDRVYNDTVVDMAWIRFLPPSFYPFHYCISTTTLTTLLCSWTDVVSCALFPFVCLHCHCGYCFIMAATY